MGKIHELPKSSSRLLTSSQIITSVHSVVKELIENSFDSTARNVEVKLEDYGLEKIEVKDNGTGIDKNDLQYIARPHFTSKITSYSDLEKVNTYGFRGEALGAICAVADLVIITKTLDESVGNSVKFNHEGHILSTKPFPCAEGTTVSVQNLFKNLPVRKQYYRSEKNKKEDLKKVEDILISFGCIQNDVRLALYHNKNLIWQKPALSCTKDALTHILGNSVADHMKYVEHIDELSKRKIEMFLPKSDAPLICSLSTSNRCITSINQRPVRIKAIDRLLKEYHSQSIQNCTKSRYPICYVSFTTSLNEVDVNIEPNKTNVILHHSEEIFAQFSDLLRTFYSSEKICKNIVLHSENNIESNKEQMSNSSDFLDSLKTACDEKIHQCKLTLTTESLPIPAAKDLVNKSSVPILNNCEKTNNSLCKRDIIEVSTPKEACKKKLKATVKVSKNDISNHISTLNNFFSSQEKNKDTLLSDSTLNGVPRVTVQRIPLGENILTPKANERENTCDLGKTTTHAISTNLSHDPSNSTPDNCHIHRKRHLSDSSLSAVKLDENILKKSALELNEQNGDPWSRGVLPSGGFFQPVKILQPKVVTVPQTNIKSPSEAKVGMKKVFEQKNLSFERKLTAFDIFCRNHRLEVAAQNPELSNQQIAQMLTEKWSSLSAEEKAVFKNMLDQDYKQAVKKKEKLGKIVSQNLTQIKNDVSSNETKLKKSRPKIKDKKILYDLQKLRSFYQSPKSETSCNDDLKLINHLAPGIWVCAKNRKLHILNTFRLQETIIYHRLLETFQFDHEPLDVPTTINTSHVGDEGMEVLMQLSNLETNINGSLSDKRLVANGFGIKLVRGANNEVAVELIGVTNNIAFYGMPDLKEILQFIRQKGLSAKLSECRPGKIILYLQSEANRMSRQGPACQRAQDVEDLLSQKNHLPANCDTCIHYKPFFNELYDFASV